MRLSFASIVLSFIALASSEDTKSDAEVATAVLNNLKSGFEALAGAANSFNGDPNGLTSAAEGLLDTLEEDLIAMEKISVLSTWACLPLVAPSLAVEKHGDILATVLKARRSEIEEHSLCNVVETFLSRGVEDSIEFKSVIKAKVPAYIRPVVELTGDKTVETLKQLRDYFSTQQCFNNMIYVDSCPYTSPLTVKQLQHCPLVQ